MNVILHKWSQNLDNRPHHREFFNGGEFVTLASYKLCSIDFCSATSDYIAAVTHNAF